eukprot:CAMPEP_0194278724 /NCGR_PEP_ID=MMETSP0169-20130528/11945_1 /TAXON_ID=218684 /ORGANISM="Corethron pennatum, Strain L29A3" /LENGTH=360 /DNA_ID=CAMNT_0039022981 /DNA_START=70 /DNA_END=1152 /DNA_ORIENTATION=+
MGKVDAGTIAAPFREEVRSKVADLKKKGIMAPLLVGILANNDPAARKYAEWTGRACQKDGIRYDLRVVEDPIDVEATLLDANDDPRVHGIIVYYPIFGQVESFSGASQDDYLRDTVSLRCDVEGLCHTYRTNLYRNIRHVDPPRNEHKCIIPCTALSVVKILEACPGCYDPALPVGRKLEGKVVTIINRSEIVGRPLAAMLANDGAAVYSVDVDSVYRFEGGRLHRCDGGDSPEACVRRSSIVVTGVPVKSYQLNAEWVRPHSTVVNVSSFKNVDEEALLAVPGVNYVPMVGKVTVAMLERNLLRLFENYHHPDSTPYRGDGGGAAPSDKAPWYGSTLQLYTAAAVTVFGAITLLRGAKK